MFARLQLIAANRTARISLRTPDSSPTSRRRGRRDRRSNSTCVQPRCSRTRRTRGGTARGSCTSRNTRDIRPRRSSCRRDIHRRGNTAGRSSRTRRTCRCCTRSRDCTRFHRNRPGPRLRTDRASAAAGSGCTPPPRNEAPCCTTCPRNIPRRHRHTAAAAGTRPRGTRARCHTRSPRNTQLPRCHTAWPRPTRRPAGRTRRRATSSANSRRSRAERAASAPLHRITIGDRGPLGSILRSRSPRVRPARGRDGAVSRAPRLAPA